MHWGGECGQISLTAAFISSLKLICKLRTAHILFIQGPWQPVWCLAQRRQPQMFLTLYYFFQMGIYLYCECLLN